MGFKSILVLKHALKTKYPVAAVLGRRSPWEEMRFFTNETLSLKRIFIAKN